MPGRCCSSTRRRAHRGSLPSPCGSVPDEAGRSRRPCAPGLPEPTAGPPYGGRPHIPAALPRTRARRSPRHASRPASRPGVAAGRRGRALSRRTARPRWPSVSRAPSGLPRPASSSDDPHRSRSRPLPGFLLSPRSGSEITEIPRRPSDLLPAVEPRRDVVRRPRTDQTRPSPSGLPSGLSTASGRSHQLVADPEGPSPPVPRAVHRVTHRGALFCGNRRQAPTRLSSHGQVRHSYTACGWSCPQSSTGLLWVFTTAECRRRRWTTGSSVSRQILTTSWFSPRNLWTEVFVHTLWTAHPDRVCAQFCGQLWMKALLVWTGHPRSVDDVWGQIGRPQAPRLSHTGHTGSSTRICAL